VSTESRIPPGPLERRIRLLLHAYPPGYRADRGAEMLGTLLEATPDGRDWPSARDSWSLLAGGARARRTANRQLGPATSLRQAVVLGLALYVSLESAQFFMPDPLTRAHGTPMLAGLLLAATVLAVWAGHRTLMVTTAAASLAVLAYYWYSYWAIPAFRHRPPFEWTALQLMSAVPLLLAIPALAWLATDARPALGVALALVVSQAVPLATFVQVDIAEHEPVASVWQWHQSADVEKLALAVVMTVAMAWMLRRRTRPHPR
jgi:hypothetical protein